MNYESCNQLIINEYWIPHRKEVEYLLLSDYIDI